MAEAEKVLTEEEEAETEFDKFFKEAIDEDEGIVKDEEVKDEEEVVTDQEVTDELDISEQEQEVDVEPEPELTADESLVAAQAEIEKLKHKMSSWEGRIKTANKRADEAEAKAAELVEVKPEETDTTDISPSEDDSVLEDFKREFPDLVRPFEIMAKKHAEEIADKRLGQVTPTIEKIQQEQELSARDKWLAPITAAHEDWEEINESGELQKWIATQPSLQQRVLNEVVKNGTQEEIIGMFNAYKKSKNIPLKKQQPTSVVVDDVSALVAVPASPAITPSKKQVDPNDYDAGWEDATSQK
jgi:hypothetical protein